MRRDELARRIMRLTETCDCCPTMDERTALHVADIAIEALRPVIVVPDRISRLRDLAADNSRLNAELHRARYGDTR